MVKRLLVLLIVSCLFFNSNVVANQNGDEQEWRQLNQTADKVLQLVKEEKYSEAKQLLEYFSKQFLAMRYDNHEISMTHLRLITTSYEKALGAVTSMSMSHEQRVVATSEFRLVVDALTSEHHPLWKQTQRQVLDSFSKMKDAAEIGDSNAFQHFLNLFLQKYAMIRPAIMVDLQPHQFQRIDSHVKYVERYRATFVSEEDKIKHLKIMEQDFRKLYKGFTEDEADPSLWWVIFTIGGTIIVSLFYTGYKKYKAEKNKVKMKQ